MLMEGATLQYRGSSITVLSWYACCPWDMESCDSAKSPRQLSTDKWGWESWGWPLWESWLSEIQPVLGAPRETDLTAHSGWPGC